MVRQPIESGLRDSLDVKADPEVAENLERYIVRTGGHPRRRSHSSHDPISTGWMETFEIWGTKEVITVPGRTRTNTGREGMQEPTRTGRPST